MLKILPSAPQMSPCFPQKQMRKALLPQINGEGNIISEWFSSLSYAARPVAAQNWELNLDRALCKALAVTFSQTAHDDSPQALGSAVEGVESVELTYYGHCYPWL